MGGSNVGRWGRGRWLQIRGRIKEAWGDITDDELDRVGGRGDQLVRRWQQRSGQAR
ncbi:MAG: CsbD family protein [Anaerolineae bacterium]|nr:CsbD family protein [Anaerolineae bacterium]